MKQLNVKKLVLLNLPYLLLGLFATNLGEAWRLAVGLCCGAGLRLAVYLRGKNAKKYRHNVEYGSARWSA